MTNILATGLDLRPGTFFCRNHEDREPHIHRFWRVRWLLRFIAKLTSYSSSGLGLATVEDLLKSNGFVAVLDLRSSEALNVPKVKFIKCNITKVEEIEAAVEETVKWTAETGATLGGVINCAGVGTAAKVSYVETFGSVKLNFFR